MKDDVRGLCLSVLAALALLAFPVCRVILYMLDPRTVQVDGWLFLALSLALLSLIPILLSALAIARIHSLMSRRCSLCGGHMRFIGRKRVVARREGDTQSVLAAIHRCKECGKEDLYHVAIQQRYHRPSK